MGKTSSRKGESKHADRKFEKKLEFYSKVRETVALGAQKSIKKKKKLRTRQKKLKAYNLSSLSEFLPDLDSSSKQAPSAAEFKVTSKSRQKLVMKEANQLKTVLNNPSFQADPLVAINQHLQNTQPVYDEKPARKNEKRKKVKKSKKKRSNAATGSQSMEE